MSDAIPFSDLFQGKPLGEQPRGTMFQIPGMPPNGKHRVVLKRVVGDDGVKIKGKNCGDGTRFDCGVLKAGESYVLTVRGWDDGGNKVVRHITGIEVPSDRNVLFVFAWRSFGYAVLCTDDRDGEEED